MDRQEVITELRRYQEEFNLASLNLVKSTIGLVNDRERAEESRLSAIANAPDGVLDGKNETERKQKLDLYLGQDEAYKKLRGFAQQDEWEVAQDQANIEIARMGIRVLETVAKLLEPQP